MRTKFLAALAATAALTLSAPVTPAVADTDGCVAKAEFKKVSKGMRINRVHNIFDTKGKQTMSGYGMQFREYKTCTNPQWGFVTVDYQKKGGVWKVTGKFAYWG